MRACRVPRLGEPAEVVEVVEVPVPVAGPGELVIRVRSAAANFADALMCRGLYQVKPDLPFTPGIELCGEVVALGDGVEGVSHSQRVLGSTIEPYGGFAEYAVIKARAACPAPASLDDAQAASLFVSYQTGWFGLHRRAALQPGETLLVHAAAGGAGSAAVQLGKAVGARVIGVAGGPEKTALAVRLGADVVIDRHAEDFVAVVNEHTDGHGADVVYDPVGGETYRRSTKCIAFEGRIVVVGFAAGEIQSVALNHALVKNYSILGLHWGLYLRRDVGSIHTVHAQLTELADRGLIAPLVSERLGLDAVGDGLQRLVDGRTVGRVVVAPDPIAHTPNQSG